MARIFHDLRQTEEWANYLQQIGWQVEKIYDLHSTNSVQARLKFYEYLYIKKLPIVPLSIAKLQRPQGKINFDVLDKICRKRRVVVLYYEPNLTNLGINAYANVENQLRKFGFRRTRSSYLPRKTIWLNSTKSQKTLLAEMKPKTRYNIGLAKRSGVKVRVVNGEELLRSPLLYQSFFVLLHENARRLKIFGIPEKWFEAQIKAFGDKCFVTLAYPSTSSGQTGQAGKDHGLVAGNFFMTSKNTCFHSHNGSTELGRKLMAPTLCTWEGILEAKRRKLKIFDLDGIYGGGKSLKRWKGFSRFKRGFGGMEIEFFGQVTNWYWPIIKMSRKLEFVKRHQ